MNMHVLRTLPFSMYMSKGFDIYQHKQMEPRSSTKVQQYLHMNNPAFMETSQGFTPVHIPEHSPSGVISECVNPYILTYTPEEY